MNKNGKRFRITTEISFKMIFLATLIIGLLTYIIAQFLLPSERYLFNYECYSLEDGWTQLREDGSEQKIDVPGYTDAKPGEMVIIRHIVTRDMAKYGAVCIRGARQDISVYINNKRVGYYSTRNTRPFGTTSAACYLMVRIEHRDVGRVMEVHLSSNSGYSSNLRRVYYGTPEGIQRHLVFVVHGPEVFSGAALMLLSVLVTIFTCVLGVIEKHLNNIFYMTLGVFLASVWCLANSPLGQMFSANLSATSDLNFFAMMLIPMPILIYINDVQQGRYKIAYYVLEGLCTVNLWVCCILQLTNTKDFKDTYIFGFATLGLAIVLILTTLTLDLRRHLLRNYPHVAIGFVGVAVSGVWMMTLYMMRSEKFNGTPLSVGFNFLLIMAVVKAIQDIVIREREHETAIQSSRMKADFLANMSHEIRTPMNAILGMNEIILRDTREPETRDHALDIESAGKSLLALVNDVLDFSKIESGKIDIVPVEYSTKNLILDCRNLLEKRAVDKGLELYVEADSELPCALRGDEDHVRQIITNVLSNAVKYTEKGSVTISYEKRRDEFGQFLLCITVKDTGIGMTRENIEKAFESFQRLDVQKNRSIEGTGLGLAITKRLVDLMNGRIRVDSKVGEGTTFYLEIPQEVVSFSPMGPATARPVAHREKPDTFMAPDAVALLVDDVDMNLKVAKGLLKKTQMQVDTCSSGEECLKAVMKKKYDIIFLDHMMPDMDGVETFERFKRLENNPNADTPVIMLTANAIAGAREEYRDHGFADYLAKPFRFDEMKELLVRHLPAGKQKGI